MKQLFFFSIMICLNVSLNAQIQLERQVIGIGGSENSNGNTTVTSTIGETIINTGESSPRFYTQGFQQPFRIIDEINYDIELQDASCIGQSNGLARITNITGCTGPYTILWSNGKSGELNSNLTPGNYSVQIISNDGCNSETFAFEVKTISETACLLKFYTGFTPNADGVNDTWVIDNIEAFPENEINIYNRLGNRVYQAKNYNNSTKVWKGENLSGGDSPSDTYFFTFESSGMFEKGWIELIR